LTLPINLIITEGSTVAVNEEQLHPSGISLSQNYPNPFNPETRFAFSLPYSGDVSIKIYDILGNEISTLIDKFLSAGTHYVTWNTNTKVTGIYFARLKSPFGIEVKKIVLEK